jgi:molecular chaperone GrpE
MKKKKPETTREQKHTWEKMVEAEEFQSRIKDLQKEKDELFAKLQRVSADYDNLQKRTAKQITESISYEKEKVIKAILPALDNFEHTIQNTSSVETVDVFLKGTQIIYEQMLDILKSLNVEQIRALGEIFDPVIHQAVMQKTEPEQEENIVLEEFQKGYTLNGRVIRPSKVIVNKLKSNKSDTQEKATENTIDEYEIGDPE